MWAYSCRLLPLLTGGTVGRDVRAGLAEVANWALHVSTGKASVAVVALGAVEALRGTSIVHVRSWSRPRI